MICQHYEWFDEYQESHVPGYTEYHPAMTVCHIGGNPDICDGDSRKCTKPNNHMTTPDDIQLYRQAK